MFSDDLGLWFSQLYSEHCNINRMHPNEQKTRCMKQMFSLMGSGSIGH